MKKLTVVIALLLALVMILSACAGKTDPPANTSNSTPAENSGSQETTPTKPDEGTKPADDQPADPNENTQPNENTVPAGNTDPVKQDPVFSEYASGMGIP